MQHSQQTNNDFGHGRKSAIIVGPKKKLYVASYPVEQRNEMALRVEAMFDIPCGTVPNFLNLTLTPSNQILHPGEVGLGAVCGKANEGVQTFVEPFESLMPLGYFENDISFPVHR